MSLERRTWMGRMRSSFVVKVDVACWTLNAIQRAPEQQNNPMMPPDVQGYNAPPNDIAMIPEQRAPANKKEPTMSMRQARAQNPAQDRDVFRVGKTNTKTGKVTPTRIKLK